MIHKSKHLEAIIRKHWRTLAENRSGIWLDAYNFSINTLVAGTIKTTLNHNVYFITQRNDKADSHKPL